MPRRKQFRDMTDEELTDSAIVRRVFPPGVRRQIRKTVSELEKEPWKNRPARKSAKKL